MSQTQIIIIALLLAAILALLSQRAQNLLKLALEARTRRIWIVPLLLTSIFAAAAQRHPDALFAKVNTEEQRELAAYFHIRSIPTLAIFRDNIIVFSEPGALAAGALEQVLSEAKSLDMESVRRSIESEDAAEPAKGNSRAAESD